MSSDSCRLAQRRIVAGGKCAGRNKITVATPTTDAAQFVLILWPRFAGPDGSKGPRRRAAASGPGSSAPPRQDASACASRESRYPGGEGHGLRVGGEIPLCPP